MCTSTSTLLLTPGRVIIYLPTFPIVLRGRVSRGIVPSCPRAERSVFMYFFFLFFYVFSTEFKELLTLSRPFGKSEIILLGRKRTTQHYARARPYGYGVIRKTRREGVTRGIRGHTLWPNAFVSTLSRSLVVKNRQLNTKSKRSTSFWHCFEVVLWESPEFYQFGALHALRSTVQKIPTEVRQPLCCTYYYRRF